MNIDLIAVTADHKSRLQEMFQIYVLEMQSFLDPDDEKTRSIDANEILRTYWGNPPIWQYLIVADGKIAGFCLLRHYPSETETIDIYQYYVSKELRRHGLGGKSLKRLIKIHPGNWLIRVLKTNNGAFKFWLNAVDISIGTSYECESEKDDMHFIRFNTSGRTQ